MPAVLDMRSSLEALLASEPAYTQAEQYYLGIVPEYFASARLARLLQATSEKFRVNFAATPVDVLLERTKIASVAHPSATLLLEQIWQDNELEFESKDIHRRTYTYGDAYAIAWTDETLASGVSVYGHDPRSVRVFYDPQRPRVKTHAIQAWTDEDLHVRVNMYGPDVLQRYISTAPLRDNIAILDLEFTEYTPDGEGGSTVPNPVPGIVPVFHFRNDRTYGRPEHIDAYGPQDMLNKVLITMMASIDYAGFPQRYVLTGSTLEPTPAADFGPLPEGMLTTPDAYRGLPQQGAAMDASPGSTWLLNGADLKVGQFSVAESQNFLNASTSIIQMMAAVTDVPMHYFSLSGDMPSGESYRAANGPLNKKASDRQAQLGSAWNDLFDYCLAVNNVPEGADVRWEPVESANDKEFWETQTIKKTLGLPREEVFAEGGYERETVAMWEEPAPPPVIAVPSVTESAPLGEDVQV